MIKLAISQGDLERLRSERFEHPHPRVQLKMEVVLLRSQGLSNRQIMAITGVSENTIRNYLREYQEGGIERLKEFHWQPPESQLEPHRQTLEAYFEEHPPASVAEAAAKIEELAGIKRSPTQVRIFLKSLGLRPLKVGTIPSKADPDKQATFKKTSWIRVSKRREMDRAWCTL